MSRKGAHCAAWICIGSLDQRRLFLCFRLPLISISISKEQQERSHHTPPSVWNVWMWEFYTTLLSECIQNVYIYISVSFNPMQRSTITALLYSKLGHFFVDNCAVICDHCTKKSWNLISYHPIWNLLCIQISRPTMAAAFFSNVTRSLQIVCFHLSGEKKHLVGWFPVGIALPYQLLLDYEIDHFENPYWPTSKMGGDTVEFPFPCFNAIKLGFTAFRMSSYFIRSIFLFLIHQQKIRNQIEVPGSESKKCWVFEEEFPIWSKFVEIWHVITQWPVLINW